MSSCAIMSVLPMEVKLICMPCCSFLLIDDDASRKADLLSSRLLEYMSVRCMLFEVFLETSTSILGENAC